MIALSHRTSRLPALAAAGLIAVALVAAGQAAPARAAGVTVYNSIPSDYSGSEQSLGFNATATAEIGQHITLAGTDRHLEDATVVFTSWACETGVWNAGCTTTTPDASFVLPITLTVYAALPDSDVDGTLPGDVLATVTQDITVPFRPTSDPVNCTGDEANWYFDADTSACSPGLPFAASFSLGSLGAVLPDDVIVSVAFDPTAVPGGSDALNVSMRASEPTVGSDPDPDNLFWDTSFAPYYSDGGASGVGVFRSDSGWAQSLLLIAITASTPAAAGPSLAATGMPAWTSVVALGAAGALVLVGGILLARHRSRRTLTSDR